MAGECQKAKKLLVLCEDKVSVHSRESFEKKEGRIQLTGWGLVKHQYREPWFLTRT